MKPRKFDELRDIQSAYDCKFPLPMYLLQYNSVMCGPIKYWSSLFSDHDLERGTIEVLAFVEPDTNPIRIKKVSR